MWAIVRERINHGADKRIKLAHRLGRDDIAAKLDVDDVLIREFVSAWHVLDVDGVSIPLDDPDATDRLPEDIADKLSLEAALAYTGATVPNEPTPDSSDA